MPVNYAKRRLKLSEISREMEAAVDYKKWQSAGLKHDAVSGKEAWKQRDESGLYDCSDVRIRHDNLRNLIDEKNYHELLYALNEGIHGNMGGMGKHSLYTEAKVGTKQLISDYVSAIVEALHVIEQANESVISLAEKVDFFRRASHCYGRSAMMLSGGAGLVYYHHGVVQTLVDENLLPNVLSGASAGSWICAQLGTKTDEELKAGYFDKHIYDVPMHQNLADILSGRDEDLSPSTIKAMALDGFCNDMTFQEAYEHTGRYINVSIAPAEKHQTSRLMNAISSPNVYIRSAIDASSGIPGLLAPVTLYAKGANGKPKPYLASRKWVDGSLSQDLPAKRLARLFGVNHYIVSMINPASVFFVGDSQIKKQRSFREALTSQAMNFSKDLLQTAENYNYRYGASSVNPLILFAHAVLDQEYTGDINMLLRKKDYEWRNIWFNFKKPEEINRLVMAGKRDTWPKVEMIRNTTIIGHALDNILERMDLLEFGNKFSNKVSSTKLVIEKKQAKHLTSAI